MHESSSLPSNSRLLCLLYYFPPIKSIAVNRNWGVVRHLQPYFDDIHVFTTQNNRLLPQEARDTEGVKIAEIPTFDYRTLTAWLRPNRSEMHYTEGTKSSPIVRFAIRLLDSFPFNLLFHEGGLFYSIIGFWRAAKLIRREKITHIYSSFRPMSDHFTAHLLKIAFPHLVWIWDGHKELLKQYSLHGPVLDQPTAGLLIDLQQRGLLEDTLVVWCTEFGRMPTFQKGAQGRDHNPAGFTCWMAGAGVKKGFSYGATDEFGYKSVENIVTVYDLHATVLHLLGLDHERLTYYHNGLERRLTDVHGEVVKGILT